MGGGGFYLHAGQGSVRVGRGEGTGGSVFPEEVLLIEVLRLVVIVLKRFLSFTVWV